MRKSNVRYTLLMVVVILSMVLSACQTAATTAPTAVPTTKPAEPTKPAKPPLGTAENPMIMAMAPSATSQQLAVGGEAIAKKLNELTGYTFKVTIPNSYAALIEAMGSGNAQVGWLPPFAYLLAKQKGFAEVGLTTLRNGSDHYGLQFVAGADSKFTSYFDTATNKNTGDAATALKQFDGKKPCWTDPLSASGYVLPAGIVGKAGVKVKAAAFVQGHPTVITALYAGGICDFGATYIDARTDKSLADKKDVLDKVVVIYRSDPIIPNDNVSYSKDLTKEMRDKINQAFVTMSGTDEGKKILLDAGYQVEGLKIVDDSFYDEFRVYLQASGVDLTTLVK